MSKLLNLIILLGLLSCTMNPANNCCFFKIHQKKIIGVCEVKFSQLYGDSIYLLDNITINYAENRIGLGYGSVLSACSPLQKYLKNQSNIEKFHPWLASKFISNGANLFAKLGSKDVFMVYGLEMQGVLIKMDSVEPVCKTYLCKQLYSGFGDASGLENSDCVLPTHYDSIFTVPLDYLSKQKLLTIDSLRPFKCFIKD